MHLLAQEQTSAEKGRATTVLFGFLWPALYRIWRAELWAAEPPSVHSNLPWISMLSTVCRTLLYWVSPWLSVGVASRPAPVGGQQVQGLLPVSFLAAGTLDRGDHWWPPAVYQFHSLLLTLPLPHCLLGSTVGEGLCQVSNGQNFQILFLSLICYEL